MADVPHYCSACGEIHGGSSAESAEVKVARINADRDIRIAELARSEGRQEIEAEVEQTEIIAEAELAETEIVAEAIVEAGLPEADEEVPVVEAPVMIEAPEPEPEAEAVPEPPETSAAPASKKNAGWWDGYR